MPMRFGTFMAPFHPPEHNPTLSLEADLDLLEHMDTLGFDEAWIGELRSPRRVDRLAMLHPP